MRKISFVVGARPQFIKHAPVEQAFKRFFDVFTIHTGQHYDEKMSDIFFSELNIDKPKYTLQTGGMLHGKQTALMLEGIEEILISEKPMGLVVYGDTNSTVAGAMAAAKLNIPVIHIEAGIRSYNKSMPEEINRVITDHLSSILFAPSNTAIKCLSYEGINSSVYNVGDVMYDSLMLAKQRVGNNLTIDEQILLTLHRPYNTDNYDRLYSILHHINESGKQVIFPLHPRTRKILTINQFNFEHFNNIEFIDPVSYFELVKLEMTSTIIITDSGGIQKEAYWLRKKCITIRSETEWPETLLNGWNTLIFDNLDKLSIVINNPVGEYIPNLFGSSNASIAISEIVHTQLGAEKLPG